MFHNVRATTKINTSVGYESCHTLPGKNSPAVVSIHRIFPVKYEANMAIKSMK